MSNHDSNGFVKISRKILDWQWYSDANTFRLFIHCLLKANWKKKSWKNYVCNRGQFITSLSQLSYELGLTIQQVRTAISHLETTGEITSRTDGKVRIITVNNYDKYQSINKGDNKEKTKKQQAAQQGSNKVVTTTKEYKESTTYLRNKEGGCAAVSPSGIDPNYEPEGDDPVWAYYKETGRI